MNCLLHKYCNYCCISLLILCKYRPTCKISRVSPHCPHNHNTLCTEIHLWVCQSRPFSIGYHFCMMDIPNLFNCGDLLGNFSSPCRPLRLGCENIYQTCFSPSLWQNRWFQRQVEGICVHRECFEEKTDNSWPPRCASQKQDSRNIVEPISKRIVNKRWRVWNTPMASVNFETSSLMIFAHPYDPNIGVCCEN